MQPAAGLGNRGRQFAYAAVPLRRPAKGALAMSRPANPTTADAPTADAAAADGPDALPSALPTATSDATSDAPPEVVDDADEPTSWRQILLRNAFLLSVIAVAFFAGVFAAETVGTYMDHRAHAESEAAADDELLFK